MNIYTPLFKRHRELALKVVLDLATPADHEELAQVRQAMNELEAMDKKGEEPCPRKKEE